MNNIFDKFFIFMFKTKYKFQRKYLQKIMNTSFKNISNFIIKLN